MKVWLKRGIIGGLILSVVVFTIFLRKIPLTYIDSIIISLLVTFIIGFIFGNFFVLLISNWSRYPFWLRGGVIGLILSPFLMVIMVYLLTFFAFLTFGKFDLLYPIVENALFLDSYGQFTIFSYFIYALCFFVLGGIIGLVLGKIKSKNIGDSEN